MDRLLMYCSRHHCRLVPRSELNGQGLSIFLYQHSCNWCIQRDRRMLLGEESSGCHTNASTHSMEKRRTGYNDISCRAGLKNMGSEAHQSATESTLLGVTRTNSLATRSTLWERAVVLGMPGICGLRNLPVGATCQSKR
jgi:hypothetical protein